MPIDTRDKRASAIACGQQWLTVFPLADASINAGDRQQAAAMYRGVASAAPQAGAAGRLLLKHVGGT